MIHSDAQATLTDEIGELLVDSSVVFSSSSAVADICDDLQLEQGTLFTQHLVHKFLKQIYIINFYYI